MTIEIGHTYGRCASPQDKALTYAFHSHWDRAPIQALWTRYEARSFRVDSRETVVSVTYAGTINRERYNHMQSCVGINDMIGH
jgi:hypothetical protein